MASETTTIQLPSLIHRIGRDRVNQAKSLANQQGCELKRIRRSRNWQLVGDPDTILALLAELRSDHATEMRYLIDKIAAVPLQPSTPLPTLHEQLVALVVQNANITLSEMMEATDCTIAEARNARFEAEMLD